MLLPLKPICEGNLFAATQQALFIFNTALARKKGHY